MKELSVEAEGLVTSLWIDCEGIAHQQGFKEYTYSGITLFVDGLLYIYGKKAGNETAKWMCEEITEKGVIPYQLLRGAFSCIVISSSSIVAFTDNSNMHCLYYSDRYVSNRFLTMIDQERKENNHPVFSEESICEYLTLGNVFFDKTFFKSIRILNAGQVIRVENGSINVSEKGIEGIDGKTMVQTISDFFEKLAWSISEHKVCQALTGGYDSRLIYACLSNYVQDHPAIASNIEKHPDTEHAMLVAKAKGDQLEVIWTRKPKFSNEMMDSVFRALDGMQPIDLDGDIRLMTFKNKLAEKYDLLLSGDGGVLHKDWEWTQDFPRYRRKKSNSRKFYLQRLYYIKNGDHLGDALRGVFSEQEQKFVKRLQGLSKSMNTQSYDEGYYTVSGNRRVNYNNNICDGLVCYAPLNEIDLVRYSYALPRFQRFFYNAMRKTITAQNVTIARIPTNYGTTASSERRYLIRDCYYQAVEYSRKAIRFVSRKLLKKTLLNASVLDWTLEEELRQSKEVVEAINFAKRKGFIKESLTEQELSYTELQRLMHIFWLAKFAGIDLYQIYKGHK